MLTKERIDQIELQAKDILLSALGEGYSSILPIDISKVAKALDLKLKEGVFKDENVAGAYDKAQKTIYISENDPYTRKAFTIAHEIGHYALHADKEQETFYRSNTILLDKEEREIEQEANMFAASLLMPKDTVTRFFHVMKNVERLADLFGVSNSSMSWRLKNLGLTE
ncbi:MAG: ImmA/IrrE family metallo-endopeptidase [Patescibacteria group bacterium]